MPAQSFTLTWEQAETPWEMGWDSDPLLCVIASGSHDQGQTVEEGEQGSPLEEMHSAG